MSGIQGVLDRLNPNAKRLLVIGGTVIAVGALVGIVLQWAGPKHKDRLPKKPQVEAVLTDNDPRQLGIASLATQVRNLQGDQARILRLLEQQQSSGRDEKGSKELDELKAQLQTLQGELGRVEKEATQRQGRKGGADGGSDEEFTADEDAMHSAPARFVPKATSSSAALGDVYSNLPAAPKEDPKARSSVKKEPVKIRTIRNQNEEKKEKAEDISVSLPAGSMLSGVLVTGMDAPTGQQAKRDPFPTLVRIKSEAILPNRFRADFRECFLIAGGWGDMSSERAYLRAERLSCVRQDGKTLEAPLEAFASGEDGKNGLRGRLVSKQGQLLARSLMAGLMQGASSVFNVRQVPSINITRSGSNGSSDQQSAVYEQVFDSNALQAAAATGMGTALDRIANYYLEMAQNLFPVIEIDAMREVDFIVNKGMTVKFNSDTLKSNESVGLNSDKKTKDNSAAGAAKGRSN